MTKTILTGVKPTGAPHLGNHIGAIKPTLRLAAEHAHSYLFIADYHALNAVRDPAAMQRDTYEVAATYLALGLDPVKTIFYRQSDIPEIFELATILAAVTPKGLMDRAHSYKAAKDKNKEEGRDDPDHGVNMGLYTYPLLMAADILVMQTDIVPVGKDQVQHVEFARDMAGYFNNNFKPTLKLPVAQVEAEAGYLPGIDGRKMSKSYNNHLPLFIDSAARRKLVMKIISDSKLPAEPKNPDENAIYQIYAQVAPAADVAVMRDAFIKGGMGYGDAKKLLADALDQAYAEPAKIYDNYMQDKSKIDALLKAGAARARVKAQETLHAVKKTIGIS